MSNRIELFRPTLGERELAAIAEVFRSGWIGYGPRCEGIERAWSFQVGARYGIATNSCTSALQIALKLREIGPGDEVIVPTITFAATAEAVMSVGATPVFCDVVPDSLLIDLESAEHLRTHRTRAIIPVLYAGQPLDIGNEWCGLSVIYDCAHAAGSSFKASGKLCCWSFQAVKNLGCGDGGMITTDSIDDQTRGKSLAWHGISHNTWTRSSGRHYSWNYNVSEIGYKAQMNDITAAILSVQIERLGEYQSERRKMAYQYINRLGGRMSIIGAGPDAHRSSWHLCVIKSEDRDALSIALAEAGIATGVHYRPLHLHSVFRPQSPLMTAEREWLRILSLPIHPGVGEAGVDLICERLELHLSRISRAA